MTTFYGRLIKEVSNLVRASLGNMIQPGVVKAIDKHKVRLLIGKNIKTGEEMYSNFLYPAGEGGFGGARRHMYYKVGQNGWMISPTGDPRQAFFLPAGPNKDFLWPNHANPDRNNDDQTKQSSTFSQISSQQQQQKKKQDTGQETWQLDDLRVLKEKKEGGKFCYSIFLLKPEKKQQQSEMKQLPEPKSDVSKKADAIIKMHSDGGITGRVGDNRFAANKKGAKVKSKQGFAVVTDDKAIIKHNKDIYIHTKQNLYVYVEKTPIINKPWVIEKKPAPDDPTGDDDKND